MGASRECELLQSLLAVARVLLTLSVAIFSSPVFLLPAACCLLC
eukprot:COSAG06_NODE_67381_length_252_cov_0.666667_1_plen_43_part_10